MRTLRVLVPWMMLCCTMFTFAQEAKPQETKPEDAQKTETKPAGAKSDSAKTETAKATPAMNPFTRLTQAKTVYLKSGGGSEIPLNVIEGSMEGWGRYVVVHSPEKADLIMEVTSPSDTGSGVSLSSSTKSDGYGRPQDTYSSSRDISSGGGTVKMIVYDARSKAALWSGMEQAKSAMRQKGREDNLVSAGQKLFTKFHDRIEPQPKE